MKSCPRYHIDTTFCYMGSAMLKPCILPSKHNSETTYVAIEKYLAMQYIVQLLHAVFVSSDSSSHRHSGKMSMMMNKAILWLHLHNWFSW